MFSSPGSVLAMRDLAQPRRHQLLHAEFRDVAVELVEPLQAPRAHEPVQPAPWECRSAPPACRPCDPDRTDPSGLSNTGTQLGAGLQDVDRMDFHQRLQPLGERRLAAADRAEQVHDLLALFQALRGVAEETDDPLDRLLHAVEFAERRIHPDRPVHENPARGGHPSRCPPSQAHRWRPTAARWRWHTSSDCRGRPREIRVASSRLRGVGRSRGRKLKRCLQRSALAAPFANRGKLHRPSRD